MRFRVPLPGLMAILLVSLAAVACGGSPPAPPPPEESGPDAATPEGTVQLFFEHLNEGRSAEAMALYTDEAREALEDPEVFGSWVAQITHEGTIKDVRIVDTAPQPGHTTVDFEIVYEDGSQVRRTVQVEGGEGQWQMGLIL